MSTFLLISTHNICFNGEIRKISVLFGWKKHLNWRYVNLSTALIAVPCNVSASFSISVNRLSKHVLFTPHISFILLRSILTLCFLEKIKDIQQQKRLNKTKGIFLITSKYQGPVVQSVVSLTSSLRVISLTVLADSIHNILIFFAEKMWVAFALQKLLTFFQQKISAYLHITRCKF